MIEGTFSRKLDTSGRLTIPLKLREELNLQIGQEYEFSLQEIDGRRYLCIDCGVCDEVANALAVLKKYGKD